MFKKQRTETVEDRIIRLISEDSGCNGHPAVEITLETNLTNDLEIDDLDLVELAEGAENEFQILISDEEFDKYFQYSSNVRSIVDYIAKKVEENTVE